MLSFAKQNSLRKDDYELSFTNVKRTSEHLKLLNLNIITHNRSKW